jgi:hypothetical protein
MGVEKKTFPCIIRALSVMTGLVPVIHVGTFNAGPKTVTGAAVDCAEVL